MISVFLMYALCGALAGILAGLLGIGGGLVIVPILVFVLEFQGIPHELIMHLSLGTSMASIVFTSVSSLWAHHKRGAVRWEVVKGITGGILLGAFIGAETAALLSTNVLKSFFVIFLFYVGVQMLTGKKPKPERQMPGKAGIFGVGGIIGMISSLVGIGGGTLSVPFMVWCNIALHQAIGTAAAIGFPIAVAGAAGYIRAGFGHPALPPGCVGFVYLPALIGLISTSMLTAPLGAKLAHSLPVDKLKRVFACLLLLTGTKMLTSIF